MYFFTSYTSNTHSYTHTHTYAHKRQALCECHGLLAAQVSQLIDALLHLTT